MFKLVFLACSLLATLIALPHQGWTQNQAAPEPTLEVLFVQNGTGVVFDKDTSTLRLRNVSNSTLWFADRPVRLAGQIPTREEFVPKWKELRQGKDSFVKDPPNAVVSVLEVGQADLQNVVVKLQNPRTEGDDLIYDITVIEGTPPQVAGATALFIDIFGVWRRNLRRTAVTGGAVK
jgi:hypothetical protein